MNLPAAYLNPPTTRANLVQGAEGAFTDSQESSRGLSNSKDLERLLALRKLADVVVADGQTARLENYAIPNACDLAVFTKKGFTPKPGASRRNYLELRMGAVEAITELLNRGYSRILIETGPTQLAAIIEAHLLNQLCLTNTQDSQPVLNVLQISDAREIYCEPLADTTFRIYDQIQPY